MIKYQRMFSLSLISLFIIIGYSIGVSGLITNQIKQTDSIIDINNVALNSGELSVDTVGSNVEFPLYVNLEAASARNPEEHGTDVPPVPSRFIPAGTDVPRRPSPSIPAIENVYSMTPGLEPTEGTDVPSRPAPSIPAIMDVSLDSSSSSSTSDSESEDDFEDPEFFEKLNKRLQKKSSRRNSRKRTDVSLKPSRSIAAFDNPCYHELGAVGGRKPEKHRTDVSLEPSRSIRAFDNPCYHELGAVGGRKPEKHRTDVSLKPSRSVPALNHPCYDELGAVGGRKPEKHFIKVNPDYTEPCDSWSKIRHHHHHHFHRRHQRTGVSLLKPSQSSAAVDPDYSEPYDSWREGMDAPLRPSRSTPAVENVYSLARAFETEFGHGKPATYQGFIHKLAKSFRSGFRIIGANIQEGFPVEPAATKVKGKDSDDRLAFAWVDRSGILHFGPKQADVKQNPLVLDKGATSELLKQIYKHLNHMLKCLEHQIPYSMVFFIHGKSLQVEFQPGRMTMLGLDAAASDNVIKDGDDLLRLLRMSGVQAIFVARDLLHRNLWFKSFFRSISRPEQSGSEFERDFHNFCSSRGIRSETLPVSFEGFADYLKGLSKYLEDFQKKGAFLRENIILLQSNKNHAEFALKNKYWSLFIDGFGLRSLDSLEFAVGSLFPF